MAASPTEDATLAYEAISHPAASLEEINKALTSPALPDFEGRKLVQSNSLSNPFTLMKNDFYILGHAFTDGFITVRAACIRNPAIAYKATFRAAEAGFSWVELVHSGTGRKKGHNVKIAVLGGGPVLCVGAFDKSLKTFSADPRQVSLAPMSLAEGLYTAHCAELASHRSRAPVEMAVLQALAHGGVRAHRQPRAAEADSGAKKAPPAN